MQRFIAIVFFWLCLFTVAHAQPPMPPDALGLVWHNDSVMLVRQPQPRKVIIEYWEPKSELLAIGVRPGTLLFDGWWHGPMLRGDARVFNLVCGAVPYKVSGQFESPGLLVLRGPQMRVDTFCQPYYHEWTVNSELGFVQIKGSWR